MKNNHIFIIAEAGINHNGKIHLAKKLVDISKKAGADAVKFQTFKAKDVISKYAKKLNYQKKNREDFESQQKMLKKFELSYSEFEILKKYCDKKKILFMSTPKNIESAIFLNKINMKIFKIGSGEAINYPLIKKISSFNKKTIVSTGMCTINEVNKITKIFSKKKNLSLLHCTSLYPCPLKECNLLSITKLKKKFKNIEIGFSDHTLGITASLAAVALGAKIIEKHITLNNSMNGPDHKASLNFKNFSKMVKDIREIEKLMGKEVKKPTSSEKKNIKNIRRGLVYTRNLKKDYLIKKSDLSLMRPLLGLAPGTENKVLGKRLKKNVVEDQPVRIKDFINA